MKQDKAKAAHEEGGGILTQLVILLWLLLNPWVLGALAGIGFIVLFFRGL